MSRLTACLAVLLLVSGCAGVEPMTANEIEQAGRGDPTLPGLFSGEKGEFVILSR